MNFALRQASHSQHGARNSLRCVLTTMQGKTFPAMPGETWRR